MVKIPDSLITLLPNVYRDLDENQALELFLTLPVPILRALQDTSLDFPILNDLNQVDERFLPLLASLFADPLPPGSPAQEQRRHIREAIPRYRRIGTVPALTRDLTDVGWLGSIDETFRRVSRLNHRAEFNRARLAGRIFSPGVFRLRSDVQVHGIREIVARHQPAGTGDYYWQWLTCLGDSSEIAVGDLKAFFEQFSFQDLTGIFSVHRHRLNGDRRLTRQRNHASVQRVRVTTLNECLPKPTVALLSRWHAPIAGRLRTNLGRLNAAAFTNPWESAAKLIVEHRVVFPGDSQPERNQHLNQGLKLQDAEVIEHFRWRKVDFAESTAALVEGKSTLVLGVVSWSRPNHSFQVSATPLNKSPLQSSAELPASTFQVCMANVRYAAPAAAITIVDRRLARTTAFRANNHRLNYQRVTHSSVSDQVARFQHRSKIRDIRFRFSVNRSRLNRAERVLTVTGPLPSRVNWGRLNRSRLVAADDGIDWEIQTKAHRAFEFHGPENAVHLRATRWPTT